jgi:hypothetical protein
LLARRGAAANEIPRKKKGQGWLEPSEIKNGEGRMFPMSTRRYDLSVNALLPAANPKRLRMLHIGSGFR